jgi:pilus assembly protein CpaB
MRLNSLVMLVLALVCGALAVLAGNAWLAKQTASRQVVAIPAAAPLPPPVATLVVASVPLRFGDEVGARNLREIPWPADAIPAGAFARVADVLDAEDKRYVLAPMEANEPILAAKITGPGQRAGLSSLIDEGMGAVTIQVNEVVGVGGFVLPGDRVDVLVTRLDAGGDGGPSNAGSSFADVVLQNVKVLAVGQLADQKAVKPALVNAVTVEVGPVGAQKIALAARAGSLSLMLRRAGDQASAPARRVSLNEVGQAPQPAAASSGGLVRVTRGIERREYSVPSEAAVPRPPIVATPAKTTAELRRSPREF